MISCITTTYKRPETLKLAIESVQNQSFQDWEHIIVHDGPADEDTLKVISEYKDDKRVTFIQTEKNHGNHTHPKNVGILASKGDLICYLDDDNEYCPTFMETLKLELELSQVDGVYGLERIFKDRNDERGSEAISFPFNPQILILRSFIDTNAVLHTRNAVFQVGGWDETLPRFADWNLFVRMAKAGLNFKQIPIFLTRYFISEDNSAKKHPAVSWTDPQTGMIMFDPTWFSPAGCDIWCPYLGGEKPQPKVVLFSLWYQRPEYSMNFMESLKSSTEYPYEIVIVAQTLEDAELAKKYTKHVIENKENVGLTKGSNQAIDYIKENMEVDIIGKTDNDLLFLTKGWLEDYVAMWRRNRMLYISSYPEGLVDHPGGPWRAGFATLGGEYIEITDHLSGICAFIDAKAYDNFRWTDKFLHGQQDGEASDSFVKQGYMPLIMPKHRIMHQDTTAGQKEKYPEYFQRRVKEKQTHYEPDKEVD